MKASKSRILLVVFFFSLVKLHGTFPSFVVAQTCKTIEAFRRVLLSKSNDLQCLGKRYKGSDRNTKKKLTYLHPQGETWHWNDLSLISAKEQRTLPPNSNKQMSTTMNNFLHPVQCKVLQNCTHFVWHIFKWGNVIVYVPCGVSH